jgi:predicted transcriptional regulator
MAAVALGIDEGQLARYLMELEETGLIQVSRGNLHPEEEVLSKIYSKAIDLDKVDRNPCKKVERFTLRNARGRYFTHEEEAKLMRVLTKSLAHIRSVVIVGIGAGLRPPSEIFNLFNLCPPLSITAAAQPEGEHDIFETDIHRERERRGVVMPA